MSGYSKVGLEALRSWTQTSAHKLPSVIACRCPHCDAQTNFSVPSNKVVSGMGVTFETRCPGCQKEVQFVLFLQRKSSAGVFEPHCVIIYPAFRTDLIAIELGEEVPLQLAKAIRATVDSYNAGIYSAVAVAGRRALEGIFKYLLPEQERRHTLAKMIELVSQRDDLKKPLTELSHAIRQGGNLGAHFDENSEPDEEMARLLVELLGYMVNFLYVLPKKISDIEQKIGATVR